MELLKIASIFSTDFIDFIDNDNAECAINQDNDNDYDKDNSNFGCNCEKICSTSLPSSSQCNDIINYSNDYYFPNQNAENNCIFVETETYYCRQNFPIHFNNKNYTNNDNYCKRLTSKQCVEKKKILQLRSRQCFIKNNSYQITSSHSSVLCLVPFNKSSAMQYCIMSLLFIFFSPQCVLSRSIEARSANMLMDSGIITKSPQSAVEEMNPILRHRFSSKIQERLRLLHETIDSLGSKKRLLHQKLPNGSSILMKEDDVEDLLKNGPSSGGRNCFFSPVQCRLPYLSPQSHKGITAVGVNENGNEKFDPKSSTITNSNKDNDSNNAKNNNNYNKFDDIYVKTNDALTKTREQDKRDTFFPQRLSLLNQHNKEQQLLHMGNQQPHRVSIFKTSLRKKSFQVAENSFSKKLPSAYRKHNSTLSILFFTVPY